MSKNKYKWLMNTRDVCLHKNTNTNSHELIFRASKRSKADMTTGKWGFLGTVDIRHCLLNMHTFTQLPLQDST